MPAEKLTCRQHPVHRLGEPGRSKWSGMSPPPITFVLCADDYGLSAGISDAIRRLLAAGRLSATSCMSAAPSWAEEAAGLRDFRNVADIGLHFTLSELRPLGPMPRLAPTGTFPPLWRLGRMAMQRTLDRREIEQELERQLDAFERSIGGPPDFVDGHHHVHQFPVIRDAVLAVVQRRYLRGSLYLRSCAEPATAILRRAIAPVEALILAAMGRALRRAAARAGIATNGSFRGARSFAENDCESLFDRFLRDLTPATLVMCHPGSAETGDAIGAARAQEYAFLGGPRFPALLAACNAVPGRMAAARAG
jgi:predicted glycoside hydrolase/deacetylase ChbG (UPF0249 family)